MKKICLVLIMILFISGEAIGKDRLSINLKVCSDFWAVRRIGYAYSSWFGGWDAGDIIEEEKAYGFVSGPEVNYLFPCDWLFWKTCYLFGQGGLGTRNEFNTSLGLLLKAYGTLSLGYKYVAIENSDILDYEVSSVIFGGALIFDRDGKGFNSNLGFTIALPASSSRGKNLKDSSMIEGQIDMGYRFEKYALGIGYRAWACENPVVERENYVERVESRGHGVVFEAKRFF